MPRPNFSVDLNMSYEYADGIFTFEDGTRYTMAEALYLAHEGASGKDLEMVHRVKRVFDGELIIEREKPRTCHECRGKGYHWISHLQRREECWKCHGSGLLWP